MKCRFLAGAIVAIALAAGFPGSGVAVRFLLDGSPFGADKTLAELASGSTTTVSSDTGRTPKKDGTHTAQVVVDPANTVAETNETNNGASLTFRSKGGRVVSQP